MRADLQLGRDTARDEDSPYGRGMYGLDALMSWAFSTRLGTHVGAGRLRSDYDDAFFPSVLADERRDTLTQANAGVQWQMARNWLLEGELSYARNDTNVEVFAYDGAAVRLTVRRAWQ